MQVLIAIALKSLLIAGLTLGLLALLKQRSAAERSWVAHIGLLALVIMAFAPLVIPTWSVEAPALLGSAPPIEVAAQSATLTTDDATLTTAPKALPEIKAPSRVSISPAAAATAAYAIPAAVLLFVTFLALARLVALRARADVLVDGHWLSALARAQRRMGFKHGTALLTSNELASPISWGLMRPVIVLNDRAVEAAGEAEAIIAHELAHVARMDWVKLLLARIATALFWFNPLVWVLAREAHQLREEAADDAVLASDIVDTDYAQLLVGVARHECPGLLLGANGVAPSKSSLARRVARVLDGKSVRGPAARSFAMGVFVGAVLIAAPLAALTLTPGGTKKAAESGSPQAALAQVDTSKPYYSPSEPPADLAHIIASGVSTSVQTAKAAVAVDSVYDAQQARAEAFAEAARAAREARQDAADNAKDAMEEARNVMRVTLASNGRIDQAMKMKAAGISSDYVNAILAAQPRLRSTEAANFAGLKAIGLSPEYARELAAAGFRNLDLNDLTTARAIGLEGAYVSGMASAGVPLQLNDYVKLRTVGVPVSYVTSIRRAGYSVTDTDKIVEMWAVGVKPDDLRVRVQPPAPPRISRMGLPAAAPPNWRSPPAPPAPRPDPDDG
jgi:beta-lactamase regulating signal transducer with metallopeptidase domain